jgi:hypothetical protein
MEKTTKKIRREYQNRPPCRRCRVEEAPHGQYILTHEATGQTGRFYYQETGKTWELVPV